MVGRARLRVGRPVRFALVIALVIVAHSLALRWLSDALQNAPLLKPMATPMFTRVLQPQQPAVIAEAPAPAAPAPRAPAITSVRKKAPKPAKAASSPAPDVEPATESGPSNLTDATVAAAEAAPEAEPVPEPASAASSAPASAPSPEVAASTPEPTQTTASIAPLTTASAPTQAASAPPTAEINLDTWPADTRLNYRLSGWFRGELYGSARVQWQREEQRYQSRVEIDVTPFVSLVLTSQGEVTAQGLSPRAYEELRRSGPRGVRLGDDNVTLNDGRRVPRPQGVQDTASQFVELTHRFATGREKLEVGRSVNVWLARPGAVDLWTYDIVEKEALQVRGMGVVEAFHLKPRPIANPRGNITAEIWFAPALQYLPVRIRVSMGTETFVDLMVENIEQK